MRLGPRLAALLGLVCLVSSCISWPDPAFGWEEDEHHWRIDSEHDVVEWIEITHGLCHPSSDFDECMRGLLDGAEEIPPGSRMSFGISTPPDADLSDQPEWARPFLARTPTLEVVEARFVLDGEGRPTLWRRMRFENASTVLVRQQVGLASMGPDRESALNPLNVTPLGCRLGLIGAIADGPIWRLEGNTFVGEIPVDSASAQLWIELAQRDPVDPALRRPAEIAFNGTTLRVRWTPDETGWIGARTYGEALRKAPETAPLQTELQIEPTSTYLQLRHDAGLDVGS